MRSLCLRFWRFWPVVRMRAGLARKCRPLIALVPGFPSSSWLWHRGRIAAAEVFERTREFSVRRFLRESDAANRPWAPWRRGTLLLALLLLMSVSQSGCQVGRTFFQMDSDSPAPFFGMDLLSKRRETSPIKEVSRFQDDVVSMSASAARNNASTAEEEEQANARPSSGLSQKWMQLLGGTPKEKSLPLPATASADFDSRESDVPVEAFR